MEQIFIHRNVDGYVYGGSTDFEYASHNRYWHPAGEDRDKVDGCAPCQLELWEVPDTLPFEAQGTSEQTFADGYEAYSALVRYGKLVETTI